MPIEKNINVKLSLFLGLILSLIISSHLLSILVIFILVVPLFFYQIVYLKSLQALINYLIAGLTSFLLTLPVLYRYFIINSSGILPPFDKGNVTGEPLSQIITNFSWGTQTTLSTATVISLLAVLLFFNKENKKKLVPWLFMEGTIILWSTDMIPWCFLNKVPFLNNMQYTPWRFMIFSSAIPLILLLKNFTEKNYNVILLILSVMAIISAAQSIGSFYQNNKNSSLPVLDSSVTNEIGYEQSVKLTSSGIVSNEISRTLIPDYAPNTVKTMPNTNNLKLNNWYEKIIKQHIGLDHSKTGINYLKFGKLTHIKNDEIRIAFKDTKAGRISLPIYGYKSLHYKLWNGNKKTDYKVDKNGFLSISVKNNRITKVTVKYRYPNIYPYICLLSGVLAFLVIVCLVKIKKNYPLNKM